MKKILYYFSELSDDQIHKFSQLNSLYLNWNTKINVISRKNMNFFYQNHVLHSLVIGKIIQFKPHTKILDIGTGGGFPGIPLSILFPDANFCLIDSIGKKIKVVKNICKTLKLNNVESRIIRAEKLNQKFHFIISRGVAKISDLMLWSYNLLLKKKSFNEFNNGIFCLKGGNLNQELKNFPKSICYNVSNFYSEFFFETKKIIYLDMLKTKINKSN